MLLLLVVAAPFGGCAAKVTRKNFAAIELGTTTIEQVRERIGSPDETQRMESAGGTFDLYHYFSADSFAQKHALIEFRNGLANACGLYQDQQANQPKGSADAAASLVVGRTTKRDVEALWGVANARAQSTTRIKLFRELLAGGDELWCYHWTRNGLNTKARSVYVVFDARGVVLRKMERETTGEASYRLAGYAAPDIRGFE